MIGVIILGILNIVFGRIIIALGSYFQANNHQEVLGQITRPILNRIIDKLPALLVTLVMSKAAFFILC